MSMLALDDQYNPIYQGLSEVREIFHREGRLSDSNQKLDECLKLLAIHFAGSKGLLDERTFNECQVRESFSLDKIESLFSSLRNLDIFCTEEGDPLFENSEKLSFVQGDESLAYELFSTLAFASVGSASRASNIDILNEAFGYFVRDNFRSNVEDAQYMTPPEVVEFMVSVALDILEKQECRSDSDELIVMDPSCGVGSFLSEFYRQDRESVTKVKYVAQDKVERMARLAAANFIFSETSNYEVHVGNSLYDGAAIDKWNAKVDVILTNPPFGARFTRDEICEKCQINASNYASSKSLPSTIDSELVFLDRYISLLKEGGICLAVIPDGVISAKGPAALARSLLLRKAKVLAIIELPPVTFAQAGTRTKTSIIVFEKLSTDQSGDSETTCFFSEVNDVGFQVSKRKGVAVKRIEGSNELPSVLASWKQEKTNFPKESVQSCWSKTDLKELAAWTPRLIIFREKNTNSENNTLVKLRDLVEPPEKRKSMSYESGRLFISILHVIGEGLLDINSMLSYEPVTPGKPVYPGEVLISRINPRISRVLVVPPLDQQIICSTEFEILKPKKEIDPYALAYSLLTPFAQEQLQSLTAGTSASHARIKPGNALEVMLPWPNDKSFEAEMRQHREDLSSIFQHMHAIIDRRKRLDVA